MNPEQLSTSMNPERERLNALTSRVGNLPVALRQGDASAGSATENESGCKKRYTPFLQNFCIELFQFGDIVAEGIAL